MSAPTTVSFRLNGHDQLWMGDPSARLLDVLRDGLGQTDVKCGCREGECGACSVLLDNQLVNSCLVAMGRVAGCEVTTVQGYSQTPGFALLDAAFAQAGAVQCGFCTPGMVLAGAALLHQDPNPSEDEIRTAISGNLCRCTGYLAIVRAIADAAQKAAALVEPGGGAGARADAGARPGAGPSAGAGVGADAGQDAGPDAGQDAVPSAGPSAGSGGAIW